MNRLASPRLASAARPARRSLIEFTLPAVQGATTAPNASALQSAAVEQLRPRRPSTPLQLAPTPRAVIPAPEKTPRKPPKNSPEKLAKIAPKIALKKELRRARPSASVPLEPIKIGVGVLTPSLCDPAPVTAAVNICTAAFEIMAANVRATFEYAGRMRGAQKPSEIVQLSAGHLRRQVELAWKHSSALGALTRSLSANRKPKVAKPRAK
jgi:hypothetical protein